MRDPVKLPPHALLPTVILGKAADTLTALPLEFQKGTAGTVLAWPLVPNPSNCGRESPSLSDGGDNEHLLVAIPEEGMPSSELSPCRPSPTGLTGSHLGRGSDSGKVPVA